MGNFKAIAMRCNTEQLLEIEKHFERRIIKETEDSEEYPYLTNNYNNKELNFGFTNQNASVHAKLYNKRTFFDEWNKKVFLEHCGVDVKEDITESSQEPLFGISKERILKIFEQTSVNNQEELQSWFPDAFEVEAEVGNWYKNNQGAIFL